MGAEARGREAFRDWLIGQSRSDQTVRGYLAVYALWERSCQHRRVQPWRATREQVSEWVGSRRRNSASTQRNGIVALKSYHRFLIAAGFRRDDPTRSLKAPRVLLKPVNPYSREDMDRLFLAARKPADRAMLTLLIGGGLRCSELLGIRKEDIDWTRGVVRIRGKGAKERLVAPGPKTMAALQTHVNGLAPTIWKIRTPSGLRSWLARLASRAGVEAANVHRMRHTSACELSRAGVDLGQLMTILGHSQVTMARHYASAVQQEVALERQAALSPAERLGA